MQQNKRKKQRKKAAKNKQKAEDDTSKKAPETKTECIFCKIIAGTIPCYKVFENDKAIAFLDAFPSCVGHTLVVPKEHFATYDQISSPVANAIHEVMSAASKAVKKLDGVTGFNIIQNNGTSAGQLVHHAHFHIIPRREGDELFHCPKSGPMLKKEDGDALAAKLINFLKK